MTSTKIFFITGNNNKFREIQAVLGQDAVEQLDIDLPEIQDLNPEAIIRAKLEAAFEHHEGPFIVEDTSLAIEGLGGLPGPFIKWFLKTVAAEGIYELAAARGNTKSLARTMIGFARARGDIQFFEGQLNGEVVSPAGEEGFGWDFIFRPEGSSQTFAEMGRQAKNEISMRRKAAEKLKESLI